MEFSIDVLFLLFVVAIVAGSVDAIAGGAGLITIPVLLAVGVPPAAAVATNKLGGVAGTFSSTVHFIRKGQIDLKQSVLMVLTTFAGSVLGGVLLTKVDGRFLGSIVPILLISFSAYFLFSPNVGKLDKKNLISVFAFSFTFSPLIGFYDGFFGPGAGAFFCLALVLLLGFNIIKATAHAKLLNFSSNLAALVFFIWHGSILWEVGVSMMLGQFIGGNIGARIIVRHGARVIKIIMAIVACAISGKIILGK